jgi:hypothetical protein
MLNKRKLQSVTANLADLAATMPTQRLMSVANSDLVASPVARRATPSEPQVQFSFSMRRSLRRELDRLAADSEMTMRAFVLGALRDKGLTVTDEDLLDLRKPRAN